MAFSDNFNSGNAALGTRPGWTRLQGTTDDASIVSGVLQRPTSTGGSLFYATQDDGQTSQEVSADLLVAINVAAGVLCSVSGGLLNGYLLRAQTGLTAVRLLRVTGGVLTTLATSGTLTNCVGVRLSVSIVSGNPVLTAHRWDGTTWVQVIAPYTDSSTSKHISGRRGIVFPSTTSVSVPALDNYADNSTSSASGITIAEKGSGYTWRQGQTVTYAGTYTGTLTNVEARIVDAGGVAVAGFDWSVKVATPTGGTYTVTFTGVPKGSGYRVQVRDGGNHTRQQNGSSEFRVGKVVLLWGQSQCHRLGSLGLGLASPVAGLKAAFLALADETKPGTPTVTDIASGHTSVGSGVVELANEAHAVDPTTPVMFVDVNYPGTSIDQWINNATDTGMTWSLWTGFAAAMMDACSRQADIVVFDQGTSNVGTHTTYAAKMDTLKGMFETALPGQAPLFVVMPHSRSDDGVQTWNLRNVQHQHALSGGTWRLGRSCLDRQMDADGSPHQVGGATGNIRTGRQYGRAIAKHLLSTAIDAAGPVITTASFTDSARNIIELTYDQNIRLANGTAFSGTAVSLIAGLFHTSIDSGATFTSTTAPGHTAALTAANKVRISKSSGSWPQGTTRVDYLRGIPFASDSLNTAEFVGTEANMEANFLSNVITGTTSFDGNRGMPASGVMGTGITVAEAGSHTEGVRLTSPTIMRVVHTLPVDTFNTITLDATKFKVWATSGYGHVDVTAVTKIQDNSPTLVFDLTLSRSICTNEKVDLEILDGAIVDSLGVITPTGFRYGYNVTVSAGAAPPATTTTVSHGRTSVTLGTACAVNFYVDGVPAITVGAGTVNVTATGPVEGAIGTGTGHGAWKNPVHGTTHPFDSRAVNGYITTNLLAYPTSFAAGDSLVKARSAPDPLRDGAIVGKPTPVEWYGVYHFVASAPVANQFAPPALGYTAAVARPTIVVDVNAIVAALPSFDLTPITGTQPVVDDWIQRLEQSNVGRYLGANTMSEDLISMFFTTTHGYGLRQVETISNATVHLMGNVATVEQKRAIVRSLIHHGTQMYWAVARHGTALPENGGLEQGYLAAVVLALNYSGNSNLLSTLRTTFGMNELGQTYYWSQAEIDMITTKQVHYAINKTITAVNGADITFSTGANFEIENVLTQMLLTNGTGEWPVTAHVRFSNTVTLNTTAHGLAVGNVIWFKLPFPTPAIGTPDWRLRHKLAPLRTLHHNQTYRNLNLWSTQLMLLESLRLVGSLGWPAWKDECRAANNTTGYLAPGYTSPKRHESVYIGRFWDAYHTQTLALSGGTAVTVNAGVDQVGLLGTTAMLSGSHANTSGTVTVAWSGGTGTIANGTTLTPTFTATVAGNHTLTMTVTDANGTYSDTVVLSFVQSATSITQTPASATLAPGATQQFTATVRDQFGNAMTGEPIMYSADDGTISASGLYTAPAVAGGPFAITAANGVRIATSTVTVQAPQPVWPLQSQVSSGTRYGPTGVEFTGTLVVGTRDQRVI